MARLERDAKRAALLSSPLFGAMKPEELDEILKFKEEGMFLRGIVHWVGYATTSVMFDC